MVVDLPEPFGPMSPYTSPGWTENDTFFTAVKAFWPTPRLKTLVRFSMTTAASLMVDGES